MKRRIYILLLTALYCCRAHGQIYTPIPLLPQNPGLQLDPTSTGKVTLEVFLDPVCGDSAAAWGTVRELAAHYGPENITIYIHMFPLPYHRNAFLVTQGYYVVRNQACRRLQDYIDAMFANRRGFDGAGTLDETERQTVNRLAELAETATGIPKQTFMADIYNYDSEIRKAWKFAALRGTAGTPWFHVNNINLESGGSSPSLQEWINLLDPLIH